MKNIFLFLNRPLLVIFFLFFLSPSSVYAETPERILEKISKNQLVKGFQVEIDLQSSDNTDRKSDMQVTVFGRIDKKGSKLLVLFNKPTDSKGMKLLSINKKGATPVLYIYMPENGQAFELTGEDLNMQLGDTDATLGDLLSMITWDGKHTLLGTETCEDESCYVIETTQDWEIGKRIARIGSTTLLSHSIEQFDDQNKLVKKIETLESHKIGKKQCATSLKITSNRDKGSATLVTLLSGDLDVMLPDTVFQPSKLNVSCAELMRLGETYL
jgi:hypothetical protein